MAGNQIIDRRTVAIPGPTGDVTPEALAAQAAAESARDEAIHAAENSGNLAGATAKTVPADQMASVSLDGPLNARVAHFEIPRGLPGVNAVPADEAVATYLTTADSQTAVAADGRIADQVSTPGSLTVGALHGWRTGSGAHAVFIGDSITQGYKSSDTAHRWSTLLSQRLGWVEHNYAVGGAGYTVVGQSSTGRFDMQCDTAAASTDYDHSQVAFAFLMGGVNDGAPTGDTLNAALARAAASVQTLRAAFPNARIITGMGYSGWLDKTKHSLGNTGIISRLAYYRAMESALAQAGAEVVPSVWRWLAFNPAWVDEDSVHPNDSGYARIADLLSQVVAGSYAEPFVLPSTAATAGMSFGPYVTENTVVYDIVGDMMYVKGAVTVTLPSDVSTGTDVSCQLLVLPPFFRVGAYFPLGPVVMLYANNAYGASGYLQFSPMDTERRASLSASVRRSNNNVAPGDIVKFFLALNLPAYGVL
jgi:lysophospholipase L1-like esterase